MLNVYRFLLHSGLNLLLHGFLNYLSLSLCTYYLGWMSCLISFERCHSSCEEHRTSEHYQNNLVHGRIRTTNTARPPGYTSTVITTRLQLAWYEMELNVNEMYIYNILTNLHIIYFWNRHSERRSSHWYLQLHMRLAEQYRWRCADLHSGATTLS